MASLIRQPAIFVTKSLEARDPTVDPVLAGGAIPIISATADAMAELNGRVLGPAGHYAMFGFSINVLQGNLPVNGFFDSVEIVPTGERFRIWVNAGQTLYALGSISGTVSWGSPSTVIFVTGNVHFVSLSEYLTDTPRPPGGGDSGGPGAGGAHGVTGPEPVWRKI